MPNDEEPRGKADFSGLPNHPEERGMVSPLAVTLN